MVNKCTVYQNDKKIWDQCQYLNKCAPTHPQPNITPTLLSVDSCWVRGGVGVQLLRY